MTVTLLRASRAQQHDERPDATLLPKWKLDVLPVFLCSIDQDRLEPLGILCRQHPRPGSNAFLPRRSALPRFVVDECQVSRSPCLLQGLKEECRLSDILLPLRWPLPVSVPAAGDDKLVDRIPGRIRDDDRDTAPMEQHCPDGFPDEEVKKAEWIRAGAAEGGHLRRLVDVVIRTTVRRQEFDPVAVGILKRRRGRGSRSMWNWPEAGVDALQQLNDRRQTVFNLPTDGMVLGDVRIAGQDCSHGKAHAQ